MMDIQFSLSEPNSSNEHHQAFSLNNCSRCCCHQSYFWHNKWLPFFSIFYYILITVHACLLCTVSMLTYFNDRAWREKPNCHYWSKAGIPSVQPTFHPSRKLSKPVYSPCTEASWDTPTHARDICDSHDFISPSKNISIFFGCGLSCYDVTSLLDIRFSFFCKETIHHVWSKNHYPPWSWSFLLGILLLS